jgi:hypothetical protein
VARRPRPEPTVDLRRHHHRSGVQRPQGRLPLRLSKDGRRPPGARGHTDSRLLAGGWSSQPGGLPCPRTDVRQEELPNSAGATRRWRAPRRGAHGSPAKGRHRLAGPHSEPAAQRLTCPHARPPSLTWGRGPVVSPVRPTAGCVAQANGYSHASGRQYGSATFAEGSVDAGKVDLDAHLRACVARIPCVPELSRERLSGSGKVARAQSFRTRSSVRPAGVVTAHPRGLRTTTASSPSAPGFGSGRGPYRC